MSHAVNLIERCWKDLQRSTQLSYDLALCYSSLGTFFSPGRMEASQWRWKSSALCVWTLFTLRTMFSPLNTTLPSETFCCTQLTWGYGRLPLCSALCGRPAAVCFVSCFTCHSLSDTRLLFSVQPVSASTAHILGEVCREKQEAAIPLVRLFLHYGKIVPFISTIAHAEVNRTQWVLTHCSYSLV